MMLRKVTLPTPEGGSHILVCGIAALLSLWLRTAFPIHGIPVAGADDALFVELARNLVLGHWLGPFNDLTLVKGMFYPLFIAGSFVLGIPLKIAEQIVYLGASALVAWVVRRQVGPRSWFPALVFWALAFDPVLWTDPLARVIREGLYIGLSLAIIGLTVLASFDPADRGEERSSKTPTRLVAGLLAGLVSGCFWLTREEGAWLIPAIASIGLLAGYDAIRQWRAKHPRGSIAPCLTRFLAPWFAGGLAMAAVVGSVATINRIQYGAFETTEVLSEAFRHAYGSLARIKQDHWRRFVVFPRDVRLRAYAVSEAAREIEPSLDGRLGERWRKVGCAQMWQSDCPEILSGWFHYALSDAVAAAGHYQTAATAATFYSRLAREIDGACNRGSIACLPPRSTLAPPFRMTYLADTLRTIPVVARILLNPGKAGIGALPSQGSPDSLTRFGQMVGPLMPPTEHWRHISGWLVASGGVPILRQEDKSGAPVAAIINVGAAPDVSAVYPGFRAIRFDMQTACEDCVLAVAIEGADENRVPIRLLAARTTNVWPGLRLYIDQSVAVGTDVYEITARRQLFMIHIAAAIAAVYRVVLAPACAIAFAGVFLTISRRRQPPQPALLALALSAIVAVLTRTILLSYLDVTSIPSANALYPSPASPLLLVFTLIGSRFALYCFRTALDDRSSKLGPEEKQPAAEAPNLG